MILLRRASLLLVILVFFTSGCGKNGTKKTVPGPNDKVYTVGVSQAVEKEVPDTVTLNGKFIPLNILEVKSDFTGKVQTLSIEEGQNVLAGDVLLKIDDEKLPWILDRQRAELREAEAQAELDGQGGLGAAPVDAFEESPEETFEEEFLDDGDAFAEEGPTPSPQEGNEARDDFVEEEEEFEEEFEPEDETPFARLARLRRRAQRARQEALRRRRENQSTNNNRPAAPVVTRENNENRAALNQAKVDRIRAEVSLTEKQMEGSTLTTGIDGFISKVHVVESSMVNPGDPLIDIVTIDPIELSLRVPKEEIGKIDKKMSVQVKVPDLGEQIFKGEISFIGAELDEDQKRVEVRVRVDNRNQKVKVGMLGQASMAVADSNHKAILIPSEALFPLEGKFYVYLQKGQVASRVPVGLGGSIENMVEITRGVRPGDKVVVEGIRQFKEPEEFIKLRP